MHILGQVDQGENKILTVCEVSVKGMRLTGGGCWDAGGWWRFLSFGATGNEIFEIQILFTRSQQCCADEPVAVLSCIRRCRPGGEGNSAHRGEHMCGCARGRG